MNIETILSLQTQLDKIIQVLPDISVEFWFARNLMMPLGYLRWEKFLSVIKKPLLLVKQLVTIQMTIFAMSRKWLRLVVEQHEQLKTLTRYACYLIAASVARYRYKLFWMPASCAGMTERIILVFKFPPVSIHAFSFYVLSPPLLERMSHTHRSLALIIIKKKIT